MQREQQTHLSTQHAPNHQWPKIRNKTKPKSCKHANRDYNHIKKNNKDLTKKSTSVLTGDKEPDEIWRWGWS